MEGVRSSDVLLCRVCIEPLSLLNISGFKAHVLEKPGCFFNYVWAFKYSHDGYKCQGCSQDMGGELSLRQHWSEQLACRINILDKVIGHTNWKDMVLTDNIKAEESLGEENSSVDSASIPAHKRNVTCGAEATITMPVAVREIRPTIETESQNGGSYHGVSDDEVIIIADDDDECSRSTDSTTEYAIFNSKDETDLPISDSEPSENTASFDGPIIEKVWSKAKTCLICKGLRAPIVYKSHESLRKHMLNFHKFDNPISDDGSVRSTSREQGSSFLEKEATNSMHAAQCRKESRSSLTSHTRLSAENLDNCHECTACEKQFSSPELLQEHLSSSENCQKVKECYENICCMSCREMFAEEDEKLQHIRNTCKAFYKTAFDEGRYFRGVLRTRKLRMCCCYCLEPCDDVFHHLISVKQCFRKFEMALLRNEFHIVITNKNLKCDSCERTFRKRCSLKGHKTKIHGYKSTCTKKRAAASDVPEAEHLFCFICKRYICSESQLHNHNKKCGSKVLLSRYCYLRAVWRKEEFQCKICTEKHFTTKGALKRHMRIHDKGRSRLIKYLSAP